MRVLLITDWPRFAAGTERYVLTLREELEGTGDEVRLLTSSIGTAGDGTAEYVARTTDRPVAQSLLQIANPSAVSTLARAFREFDPDVVHLAMFLPYLSPAIMGPLRSRPATMMAIDFKPCCPTGTKVLPDGSQCRDPLGAVCHRGGCLSPGRAARDALRYTGFRLGLRSLDRIMGCSAHITDELSRTGIEAEHLPLPVGPPEPAFKRAPTREPSFVYAGRLAPVKGVDLLIEAFAEILREHPSATLQICGDGALRGELIALAGRLGVGGSVRFSDRMRWEWSDHLEGAWALVAPSTYREPLGLVAIEAIVRGVPVIASGDGGFGESVEDGRSGMLFPNGDRTALVERMRRICERRDFLDHRPDPAAMGRLARRHDVGDHMGRMREIWQEIGA